MQPIEYCPIKQPGSEDPFSNAEGGAQRRARFMPCLLILVVLSLRPLHYLYGTLSWLMIAIFGLFIGSAKFCPSAMSRLSGKLLQGSRGGAADAPV